MCRWRSPLDNLETLVPRINRTRSVSTCSMAICATRFRSRRWCASRSPTTSSTSRRKASRAPASMRRSTRSTPTSRARRACSTRCAVRSTTRSIHVCASSEVFGRVPADKLPIDEECTFHPGLALCDLEGRHRSHRPLLCRSLRHDGDDDADVHPYRAAARRCLRRIDLRQADRADRSGPAAAGRARSAISIRCAPSPTCATRCAPITCW